MFFISYLGYSTANKAKEAFQNNDDLTKGLTLFWILIVVYVIIAFIWSYGAAKLSWGYNYYIGNGWGTSFTFSFLAFMFSEFYYPFYAYFLNPIYNIKKVKNT
jgi:uncharacterized membrane protein